MRLVMTVLDDEVLEYKIREYMHDIGHTLKFLKPKATIIKEMIDKLNLIKIKN